MKGLLSKMFEELAVYNSRHPSFSGVLERLIWLARTPEACSERSAGYVPFSTTESNTGTANFPSQSSGGLAGDEGASVLLPRGQSQRVMDSYVPTESSMMGAGPSHLYYMGGSGSSVAYPEKKIQVSVLES